MQVRGQMFLNTEEELLALLPFPDRRVAARLGCFLEVALLAVILEGHSPEGYNTGRWPRPPPTTAPSSVTPADCPRSSSPRCGNGSVTTACGRCCCCT